MNLKTSRAFAACMVLLAATSAFAQLDTGTITGRVTDPTGAVLVGAEVTVTNTETNFQNVTTTNEQGIYRAQSLRPGPYRVTIVAAGFKRLVREDVSLRINDTMAVNAALELGSVTDSMTISGAAPLLETETSSTGQVMEGDYFYSLPLYQRWVKSIVFVTPGLTFGFPSWPGALWGMHLNGLQTSEIGYFEDGMLATSGDQYTLDTIQNSIAEVKVLTTALPAEYGHSAGGAISVVKKGGTNELHGLLSDYGRSRSMQHRKFFDFQKLSQPLPGEPNGLGLLFMLPDGNISGPVYVPKVYNGKNKTFFMFGFQRLIAKQGQLSQVSVPTQAMKNGDFTFGGIGQQIYDPRSIRQDASGNWLEDPFPGNIIPKSQFSNVANAFLAKDPWKAQNQAGTMTTNGPDGNYRAGFLNTVIYPEYTFRLDHQFTSKFKLFGTWSWEDQWSKNGSATIVQYAPYDPNQLIIPFIFQAASVGTDWVISPTLVSETRVGFYRQSYNADPPSQLAVADTLTQDAKVPNIPAGMYINPIQGLGMRSSSVYVNQNISFKEDVTKVSGKHVFKMGYDYLRLTQNSHGYGDQTGSFTFAGTNGLRSNGTPLPNTGNSFAAFLIGEVSSATFSQPNPSWQPVTGIHSFYFQDDWKVSPNLTLNLGVRYSNESPMTTRNGKISVWDPTLKDDVYTGLGCPTGGCVGGFTHPTGAFYNRDNNNFQPRLGAAWHPLGPLVVRAGFALNTKDMRLWYNDQSEYALSTNQQQAVGNPTPLYNIDQGPNPIVYSERRPDGSVPYSGTNFSGRGASIVPKNIHNPYTMSWNLSLQYQFAKKYLLETTYAGSSAVGNIDSSQWNSIPWGYLSDDPAARDAWIPVAQYSRPWANWGGVNYTGNFDHSDFHSGTAKIETRYSHGMNFLAFYTFSKCIYGVADNRYLSWSLDKGRCDYDQTHRFVSTMLYDIPIGKGRKFMNRGGWLNAIFGQFQFVSTYSVSSGIPRYMWVGGANTQTYPSWMPGFGDAILMQRPKPRDNWQDLGGDRYTQANQNSMIDCGATTSTGNDCFTYIPSYSLGNNGRFVWNGPRIIAMNMSASKEIPIKEHLRFQFRFDIQNPFKWFTLDFPNANLDLNNPKYFGTTFGETDTATYGGPLVMNITLALRW